jgi:hypothetical protein
MRPEVHHLGSTRSRLADLAETLARQDHTHYEGRIGQRAWRLSVTAMGARS